MREGKFGGVCKHGGLMRSCEICDLQSQLHDADEALASCQAEAAGMKKAFEKQLAAARVALEYYKETYDDRGFDDIAKQALAEMQAEK
jgi:hypothetical protein